MVCVELRRVLADLAVLAMYRFNEKAFPFDNSSKDGPEDSEWLPVVEGKLNASDLVDGHGEDAGTDPVTFVFT